MKGPPLRDEGDRWSLDLVQGEITQCTFGHQFGIAIYTPRFYLNVEIESVAVIRLPGSGHSVEVDPRTKDPMAMAPALKLLHVSADRLEASRNGRLTVALGEGGLVEVAPDDDYEAWNVTGPEGLRLVSMPGGEVAVWAPSSSMTS